MDTDTNIKNSLYNDFDKNFEIAFTMSEQNFSHEEIINMLTKGNIQEKQIAALKFDRIKSVDDVKVLLNNLTGCDGKIREAVAHKIHKILLYNTDVHDLFAKNCAIKFADATIDINANICRLIVDSAALLAEFNDFSYSYVKRIITFTLEALSELDKFIFRDKKYVINKQLFKLYWCLEALCTFYDYADEQTLYEILKKCAIQKEYTVREKVAQIIINSGKFNDIKELLINDENYYVRQVLNHPSLLK